MEKDIAQVLISEEVLQKRIEELAAELTEKYAGKNPVFVGVMKGVVLFFADIVKRINTMCQIDFMWISSYSGTNSTGNMVVKRDVSTDIKGRHVVILEDIFDTGNSLQFTCEHLMKKEPTYWGFTVTAGFLRLGLSSNVQISREAGSLLSR